MSSMLTHFMSIFRLPRWADAGMDKFRMSFLWKGKNPSGVSGCNCLVNWKTCTRPKKLGGGVGIKDLEKFGRALRLRWYWNRWDTSDRHWKQLLRMKDPDDKALFFNSTFITIGNGEDTPFRDSRSSPKRHSS
jgi:hypothetical protein